MLLAQMILKLLTINIIKNNINNVIYLSNSSSHFAYASFIQALKQVSMMNTFNFKQLQKSIFTFNVQFSNIF